MAFPRGGQLAVPAAAATGSLPLADEGLGTGVTDAVEEQVEEASEGVGRGRSPVLVGLIGVGVSGRRRLVTSPSGAAAFRCRLMAADLWLERGAGAGEPGGVAVLARCLMGTTDAYGGQW